MTVRCEAPAKLTLSLRITGVRPDGYHLLESEMVTLDLADTLEIDEDAEGGATGLEVVPAWPADGVVRHGTPSGRWTTTWSCGRWPPPAGRPGCGWSSGSRPAPGWAAGRPTPPPCCGGRAVATSAVAAALGRRRALLPGRGSGPW